ncbi:MAG: superoxide dismutase family protein [Actinomycetota bacterium]|nr:superoxide dismutase family protein [Actinomycetota bacterium]
MGTQPHPGHAGDQPVLLVLNDRTSETRFTTDRYSLSDLLVPEGRAVIVHANPDNYGNVPERYTRRIDDATRSTSDAGDRIACGVIRRPEDRSGPGSPHREGLVGAADEQAGLGAAANDVEAVAEADHRQPVARHP